MTGAERWVLKGGYALELRLGHGARATRDLDLSVPPPAMPDLLEGSSGTASMRRSSVTSGTPSQKGCPAHQRRGARRLQRWRETWG